MPLSSYSDDAIPFWLGFTGLIIKVYLENMQSKKDPMDAVISFNLPFWLTISLVQMLENQKYRINGEYLFCWTE